MFDWTSHLQDVARHLLLMASTPGWDEHARLRRDALLADPMYGESLRAELNRLRREAKAKSC